MQPRPLADLTNREPLDAVHAPDLRPLLHADHGLLLARSFRSSESPDPAGRTDPAPDGSLWTGAGGPLLPGAHSPDSRILRRQRTRRWTCSRLRSRPRFVLS